MVEGFARGAFTASLVIRSDVPLVLWHDQRAFPIGSAIAWDDRCGTFRLAMTSVALLAAQHVAEGFMTGMSVGFTPVRSTWRYAAEWNPMLGLEHMDQVTRHEARTARSVADADPGLRGGTGAFGGSRQPRPGVGSTWPAS
jgi:hypothetical protein